MPELPEVQALAERLEEAAALRTLASIAPLQFSALKTAVVRPDSLHGRALGAVGRRGKFLILEFGGPRVLVHLSQGGRVDVEPSPKTTRPKGAVVRFVFEGGPAVLVKEYGTERKAGWWVLADGDDGPLASLGPEPYDEEFEDFLLTATDNRRIHSMLRDQHTVAGIGRGYTDDILHECRLSPYANLNQLDEPARRELLDTIRRVLRAALEDERERTGGLPTKLGDRFRIHRRYGHPCPRCGHDLRRVSYDAYEVAYCPPCQTGGKVLADRRMSRLVR